jgi:hypothetical protein
MSVDRSILLYIEFYCLIVIGGDFSDQIARYRIQYKQIRPLLIKGKERLAKRGVLIEIPELPEEPPEIVKDMVVTLPKSINPEICCPNHEPVSVNLFLLISD